MRYIVKLPKKGDLSDCQNWRGIQLLSIPSKIFTRVILERIRTAVSTTLRKEKAGFRARRSCTDQIANLCTIIEQSLEWQSPLYINFVDYKKAFDMVDWTDTSCRVIHNTDLSPSFEVNTGVRPVWRNENLCLHTKLRLFNTNVKSVLLYGSETWRRTKSLESKLQVFINICLRQILRIRWPE
ncbi:uncharacterized protein LOC143280323 [Babylonia areolata]|uniref:uncharacterized protein LOC143280323 n=1 Tax=Babylonia areolata TaxID=304850 RepID=UPI003FCF876B